MGQSYLLGCPEGGEAKLQAAVGKVDTAMCKIRDAGKIKARDRIAAVNADLQESLSGVRVAQAYVREGRNASSFRDLSQGYLDARVEAQRLVALYFPFVLFVSAVASVIVLGVGSGMGGAIVMASAPAPGVARVVVSAPSGGGRNMFYRGHAR